MYSGEESKNFGTFTAVPSRPQTVRLAEICDGINIRAFGRPKEVWSEVATKYYMRCFLLRGPFLCCNRIAKNWMERNGGKRAECMMMKKVAVIHNESMQTNPTQGIILQTSRQRNDMISTKIRTGKHDMLFPLRFNR